VSPKAYQKNLFIIKQIKPWGVSCILLQKIIYFYNAFPGYLSIAMAPKAIPEPKNK
jgi:hypothetical protein